MNKGLFRGFAPSATRQKFTVAGAFTNASNGAAYGGFLACTGQPISVTLARGTLPPGMGFTINGSAILPSGSSSGSSQTYGFTLKIVAADGQVAYFQSTLFIAGLTYATFDPAKVTTNTPPLALSGGNLLANNAGVNAYLCVAGTLGKSSGKWCFTMQVNATNINGFVGIAAHANGADLWSAPAGDFLGGSANSVVGEGVGLFFLTNNLYWTDASSHSNAGTGGSITDTIILVAADLTGGTVYFYNYLSQTLIGSRSLSAMTGGNVYYPYAQPQLNSSNNTTINCGQTSAITLPAALSSFNPYWAV